MALSLCYWILMLLWLVLGVGPSLRAAWKSGVPDALLFLLLVLIGWQIFGPPLHK